MKELLIKYFEGFTVTTKVVILALTASLIWGFMNDKIEAQVFVPIAASAVYFLIEKKDSNQ